jgi:hypothetical protein
MPDAPFLSLQLSEVAPSSNIRSEEEIENKADNREKNENK